MPPNVAAYQALAAESKRTRWPRYFRIDLTRFDRRILYRADAPERFGWVLRESGTHLIVPGPRAEAEYAVTSIVRAYLSIPTRWYWYNGTVLLATTPEQLITRLEEAYVPPPQPQPQPERAGGRRRGR